MEVVLIFPHHLFLNHKAFSKDRLICFIEHPLFFYDEKYPARFHQQKIVMHRASMKQFEADLQKKGYQTAYLEAEEAAKLELYLKKWKASVLQSAEFDDYILELRIKKLAETLQIPLKIYQSQAFLTPTVTFAEMYKNKKHYSMHTFYAWQRKNLGLLVDKQGKPEGGKWSYDAENRKKAPRNLSFPPIPHFSKSPEVKEAISYVQKKYPLHPGHASLFHYPTTHAEAKLQLNDFLKQRLSLFGDFEDAILQREHTLFHSQLSPLLNTGLLTPHDVVESTMNYAQTHAIPLNSLEGFLRQIIGWREFVRGVYHVAGSRQRKINFFNHTRKIPQSLYDGTTGIPPIDNCIKYLQEHAYLHHIERLMIIGNFCLLCEIDPDEVYKWFMEMFIDSYDWVMVPNVYGMSQYADGGLMTTKPYICGSNYILKMSDYKKGDWTTIWDALFWRFMYLHLSLFENQPRLKILTDRAKEKGKDLTLMRCAEKFLEQL
jgi:deoxyribodipyrimidine photolyase-related protein